MKIRLWLVWTLAAMVSASSALGQAPAGPNQPVQPQVPTFQPRAAQPLQVPQEQEPAAPFQLTAQEQANLEALLQAWEQAGARIKNFQCTFTRFEYGDAFGGNQPANQPADPNKPNRVRTGEIRYASPDQGLFAVEATKPASPNDQPIEAERWVCDGKSIYQYKYAEKKVIETPVPPELQGKAIADTPLPFLFGSSAAKLKQRYFLRLITPANLQNEEVWLEAWPKFQADRANMMAARLILKGRNLDPFALAIYQPDNSRHNYVFENVKINQTSWIPGRNLIDASVPWGWSKEIEKPAQAQAQGAPGPAAGQRR